MCNHFALKHRSDAVVASLRIKVIENPPPRGEFFPKSPVAIARDTDAGRELTGATWGIPLGNHQVVNFRDDKLHVWKRFMRRRVVLPLSYAVEWKYPIDMFGQPNGMPSRWKLFPADEGVGLVAGISDPAGHVSMMTCRAEGVAAEVHNKKPEDPRMVVFLTEPEDVDRWLDRDAGADDVLDLLKPPPEGW
ncbi:MAG: SOS response-associated peptidase family protein [Planctomycetota bacterium]